MNTPTILPTHKVICIHGKSACGKTTLAKLLAAKYPQYSIFHTDDYIKHGFKNALYVMMADMSEDPNPFKIIEGVQVPRLLRKWQEKGMAGADLILHVFCEEQTRVQRYYERGDHSKLAQLKGWDAMLQSIWDSIDHAALPQIIKVNTTPKVKA